jgi:hypothetical protein
MARWQRKKKPKKNEPPDPMIGFIVTTLPIAVAMVVLVCVYFWFFPDQLPACREAPVFRGDPVRCLR